MIWYDGIAASERGARIVRDAPNRHAARDIETEQIPGRNGALVYDNGAFLNYEQTYTLYIPNLDRRRTARYVAEWLLRRADAYYRLDDDTEPDVYRMARFVGPLDITSRLERYGTAQISFDCKPQRFFPDGDKPITLYPVVGGYVNSGTGAMTAGDAQDRRTGYMSVSPGDVIRVGIRYDYEPDDGTTGVVFAGYTAMGAAAASFVSAVTYTPTAPGSSSYEYTVPSGVSYVIIAWKSAYATVTIRTAASDAVYTEYGPIVENPTDFPASPLIQLLQADYSGSANIQGVKIGDITVLVNLTGLMPAMYDDGVVIDCDAMDTYATWISHVISLNSRTQLDDATISAEADAYPTLPPGPCVINTYNTNIGLANECPVREIVITPRWWTI